MTDLFTPGIAAVSALSGAALTGFIGARSERRKEQALERQQQRQQEAEDRRQVRELRAEHLKWRRERRQAAYEALVEATQSMDRAARGYVSVPTSSAFEDAKNALEGVEQAANKVRLEGPDEVAEAAHACQLTADSYLGQAVIAAHLSRSDTGAVIDAEHHTGAASDAYVGACQDFVVTARKSLDEVMAPE